MIDTNDDSPPTQQQPADRTSAAGPVLVWPWDAWVEVPETTVPDADAPGEVV